MQSARCHLFFKRVLSNSDILSYLEEKKRSPIDISKSNAKGRNHFVIDGSVCTDLVLEKNRLKTCRFAATLMFRAIRYKNQQDDNKQILTVSRIDFYLQIERLIFIK